MGSSIDIEQLSLIVSGLLIVVAVVHILLGFGLRRGNLVWGGDYPRRLPPSLRIRSLGLGILLLVSSSLMAQLAGFQRLDTIPERWDRSVGFVLGLFLGLTGFYMIFGGSRWERYLMGPILMSGAVLAVLLAFG